MKCCVIYTGLYNTASITLESHKKHIFDVLEKNKIDYDVNIFVSPCINLKSFTKEVFESKLEKLHKLFEENIDLNSLERVEEGYIKNCYMIERFMEVEYMKKGFYNIIKQEKIKEFITCNDVSDTILINDGFNLHDEIHSSNGFFKSNFYKRAKIMEEKINDKNYDFIIHLRPDLLITNTINEIIQKVKKLNEDFIFINGRADCMYISNEIICKKLSKENFDKILINEVDTDIKSLKYIIKNGKFPGIFHMEVYTRELYEKLNIKLEPIYIGSKMDVDRL